MILLHSILVIVIIAFLIMMGIYHTHIEMNVEQNLPYDYVNFNTFIKEFEKYKEDEELKYDKNFKSIFLKKDNDEQYIYLHASIVRIDGKCMIFYPISWLKYCLWMRSNFKKKSNRVKGLWTSKRTIIR